MSKEKAVNIWTSHIDAPAQTDFDQVYKKVSIIDKVIKTGEGVDDYIIQKVVLVDETPIAEVVGADADSVGVYNIIKQVMRTGDTSLLPVDKGTGEVLDLVGAPESLMELKAMGQNAEAAYNGLPDELKQGLDLTSFVNSMSQERFDAFVASIKERLEKKEESKDE